MKRKVILVVFPLYAVSLLAWLYISLADLRPFLLLALGVLLFFWLLNLFLEEINH